MTTIRPVILAGGRGSHPHPLSSASKPRQFLSVLEEDSPFQDTLERASGHEFLPPLIIASQSWAEIIHTQCQDIAFDYQDMLLEDEGHGTASACLIAALWASHRGEENIPLLILPSDHFIADQTAFMRAVSDATHTAEQGYIVSFGVVADRASKGYSYIKVGPRLDAGYSGHKISQFIEKPDGETAQKLLDQGCFVWNTGIFCTTPATLIQEMKNHSPSHMVPCSKAFQGMQENAIGFKLEAQAYNQCINISFDKAIMEKTDRSAVVSLLSAWSDLGTWPGLWKALTLLET